ncbi:hypothetical protein CYLTODRAFT_463794 [Cylindrobasidium torrendii FP15055 ss-10]|uniref:Uncharacterized protein n=1 Tax=Cylindrobasidium torrendii FP15055 ss-10 TaxID=1314674 RepID=A0A0D7BQK1_9AGAR|nr:hypothetical protein CYLTODRAFT_463794 [Cylindrobasidium torrendii FP15055 ss-10]
MNRQVRGYDVTVKRRIDSNQKGFEPGTNAYCGIISSLHRGRRSGDYNGSRPLNNGYYVEPFRVRKNTGKEGVLIVVRTSGAGGTVPSASEAVELSEAVKKEQCCRFQALPLLFEVDMQCRFRSSLRPFSPQDQDQLLIAERKALTQAVPSPTSALRKKIQGCPCREKLRLYYLGIYCKSETEKSKRDAGYLPSNPRGGGMPKTM